MPQGATNFPQFGACSGAASPLENASAFAFKDITYPDPKGVSTQLNLTGEISYAHNYTTHGHVGTIEAYKKYLQLASNGTYAGEVRGIIQGLESTVPASNMANGRK